MKLKLPVTISRSVLLPLAVMYFFSLFSTSRVYAGCSWAGNFITGAETDCVATGCSAHCSRVTMQCGIMPPGSVTTVFYHGDAWCDAPSGLCIADYYDCDCETDYCGGNIECFLPGTKVATPQGQKKIETLKPGDSVFSFDELTGKSVLNTVASSPSRTVSQYYIIKTQSGREVKTTAEHPFFTGKMVGSTILSSNYTKVKDLKVGDKLFVQADALLGDFVGLAGSGLVVDRIVSIDEVSQSQQVYNLHVAEPPHNFFAGGFGVHNKGGVNMLCGEINPANVTDIFNNDRYEVKYQVQCDNNCGCSKAKVGPNEGSLEEPQATDGDEYVSCISSDSRDCTNRNNWRYSSTGDEIYPNNLHRIYIKKKNMNCNYSCDSVSGYCNYQNWGSWAESCYLQCPAPTGSLSSTTVSPGADIIFTVDTALPQDTLPAVIGDTRRLHDTTGGDGTRIVYKEGTGATNYGDNYLHDCSANLDSHPLTFTCKAPTTPGLYTATFSTKKNCDVKFDYEVVISAPSQPTVSAPACSSVPYSATISWTGTPNPFFGFYVDLTKTNWSSMCDWSSMWNKNVNPGTSTTAPAGFSVFSGSLPTLTLEPENTYCARIFNGIHGPTASFNVPRCNCTGADPDIHATMCPNDDAYLTSDTPKTLVASCSQPEGSAPWCQFTCTPPYVYSNSNGVCVLPLACSISASPATGTSNTTDFTFTPTITGGVGADDYSFTWIREDTATQSVPSPSPVEAYTTGFLTSGIKHQSGIASDGSGASAECSANVVVTPVVPIPTPPDVDSTSCEIPFGYSDYNASNDCPYIKINSQGLFFSLKDKCP